MTEAAPHHSTGPRARKRSGSETRKRAPIIGFRATDEERAEIEASAARAGLKVGSYIRTQLLSAPVTRTVRQIPVERTLLAQLLGQLGKVGGNIHQISKRLNFGEGVIHPGLASALAVFREAADAILQAMGKRPHDH